MSAGQNTEVKAKLAEMFPLAFSSNLDPGKEQPISMCAQREPVKSRLTRGIKSVLTPVPASYAPSCNAHHRFPFYC
jgi:peroxiredoxin